MGEVKVDQLVLLTDYPIDQLLQDNDIEPIVVLRFLYDEGLINLKDYITEEDEEE